MIFHDRREAGRLLARAVREQVELGEDPNGAIVLALPRGGVPVAFELARELRLPLDVLVVRKLGVPGQEELAMGAIASGGILVIQPDVVHALGIPQSTIDAVAARERLEIERRELAWRPGRPPLQLQGRTAILVDDGLATGSTMRAAVRALRSLDAGSAPRRIVVAVPVAARATCDALAREADQLLCLDTPELFHAVGEFYRNFDQTSDEEVGSLLALPTQS